MGAGSIRWTGTFTLSKSGPGVVASKAVTVSGLDVTDCVTCTPSSTSYQTNWLDINGGFDVEIVKASGTFTAYADRAQLPGDVTFDYVIYSISS